MALTLWFQFWIPPNGPKECPTPSTEWRYHWEVCAGALQAVEGALHRRALTEEKDRLQRVHARNTSESETV